MAGTVHGAHGTHAEEEAAAGAGLPAWHAMARGPAQMGFGGPGCWAEADAGRAFWLNPSRKDRVSFFSEFIFNAKTIPEKSRNCLKARKILRKSQNFQENSQRLIGT
jgi:hypothetical protein